MDDDDTSNVLAWWKAQQNKFHMLFNMAHDLLSIPISPVESESTLIASGREVNEYRSRLTPTMLQALMFTLDWN